METIAVVGAGIAGTNCAYALRQAGYDGKIVMFGDEPGLPYDRPPLSKEFLLGEKADADLALHPESFFAESAIDLRSGTPVTALDISSGTVRFGDRGVLRADRVVLATGGRSRRLLVPGLELRGVLYLRTLADATLLRQRAEQANDVVIVGGGFIGAEVAASMIQLGKTVTIVEQAAELLAGPLGPSLGAAVGRIHEAHGVAVRLGVSVSAVLGARNVQAVELADGTVLPADLVLVGVGMVPNDELARNAGLVCDNGVVVNEVGESSNSAVFATGDLARFPRHTDGGLVRLEHWQHAQNHAIAVAGWVLGARSRYEDVPWFWSHQYEHDIQMAGHRDGNDTEIVRAGTSDASYCIFYVRDGVVRGAFGLNAARDVRGAMDLIRSGVQVEASDLSDPTVDLRKLARSLALLVR